MVNTTELNNKDPFNLSTGGFEIFKNGLIEFKYFVKIFMETIKQFYNIHYRKDPRIDDSLKELFSYHNF